MATRREGGLHDRRPARILVIDDDAGIRHMLSIVLDQQGREVVLSDGRDLDALGTDFDAVLIDVRLGDRTAHDVLADRPELAERPMIVMTAARESEAVAGLRHDAILAKPFDIQAVEEAIEALLEPKPPG